MKTVKITAAVVIALVLTIAITSFTPKTPEQCGCFYQDQEYSDGATSSLGSICNFKCDKGVWRCQGRDKYKPCHNQQQNQTCTQCKFMNTRYSENSLSGLNSIGTYVCHNGSWARQD